MVIKSETANIRDKHQPLKSIWDKIQEIMADVPPEELAEIPADASLNLDHYLYGSPKKTINN